ncbi:hypothetical protein ABZ467_36830 [Streptomyces sp. NPDC005727]|uniref:hypothetical protein n=1 Tax=Streptomyces sp. NPDC005727 TaxID=3157053 RepID=UPI0033C296CC
MSLTEQLRLRQVAPGRVLPDAAPVTFTPTDITVDPADIAADMRDLAARVRSLLALQQQRVLQLPLGGRLFDTVITASGPQAYAAVAVMDEIQRTTNELGGACGPVIEDPQRSWLVWLVPPGTSEQWAPHRYATCLGRPHSIALPALTTTEPPGPYWLRPFRGDRLVPPTALSEQLDLFQPGPTPHEAVLSSMLSTIS